MKKKQLFKFIKINHNTMIVGIDVGMNTNYAYFRTLTFEGAKTFSFANSREGFKILLTKMERFRQAHKLMDVVIGMESTGSYWYPLAHYLSSFNHFTLVQVNGKHTNRFKDVTDNSSNKTDHKDPSVIAQLILIGASLRVNLPKGNKASLRELTRSRRAILNDKKRIQNRLHALLANYFPEVLGLFKDICCKTCIHILREYSTPEMISNTPKEILEKELKKVSRGRFKSDKVNQLLEASKSSIGVIQGTDGFIGTLLVYLEQIDMILRQVAIIEKKIHEILSLTSEYQIIKTLAGLGDITIATIASEVGNFENFKTSRELLKFAGLNLVEKSSGKLKSKKRISKIGNERLRTSLYFATLRLIKKKAVYHDLYQMHLRKGMKKKEAIIAISRKLLRTLHALVKNGQEFNDKYELNMFNQAA